MSEQTVPEAAFEAAWEAKVAAPVLRDGGRRALRDGLEAAAPHIRADERHRIEREHMPAREAAEGWLAHASDDLERRSRADERRRIAAAVDGCLSTLLARGRIDGADRDAIRNALDGEDPNARAREGDHTGAAPEGGESGTVDRADGTEDGGGDG